MMKVNLKSVVQITKQISSDVRNDKLRLSFALTAIALFMALIYSGYALYSVQEPAQEDSAEVIGATVKEYYVIAQVRELASEPVRQSPWHDDALDLVQESLAQAR